jgi:hypothetical protein
VLASVAPFDGDGLDFYADMGEQNREEFRAAVEGEESLRAVIERQRRDLLASTPSQLVEVWQTLLGPADREVVTSPFASFVLKHVRAGIGSSANGWLDDDVAFVTDWGFDLSAILFRCWSGTERKTGSFPMGTAYGLQSTSRVSMHG